jgi:two-component system, LuxR family, sensor kinase FixL
MIEDKDLQQLFQSVLETAVDGIINIDSAGKIINVNKAAESIFGFEKIEMMGQNVSMLMNKNDAVKHDSYIHNYLTTRVPMIIGIGREVIGKKKDGSLFPFRLAVSEVILNDRVIFTGIIHDLKEIKEAYYELKKLNEELDQKVVDRTYEVEKVVNQLLEMNNQLKDEIKIRKETEKSLMDKEEQLNQALEVEKQLNELKSRFLTTASHEFRTPLTTILSSAALILKYPLAEQQANRENHISKIRSAVNHLTGVLNDFLSLSKLEEGKVNTSITLVNLRVLIDEVKENLAGILKDQQKIIVNIEENVVIHTDSSILKNILFNLISNAVKYSQSNVELSVLCSDDECTIKVNDSGIGIPKSDQQFLFSRFFRATNVGNIQGTGLGLNIVKKYCELIDGSISYESEENKGTTFYIKIKKTIS